jgi:hypothetical protein
MQDFSQLTEGNLDRNPILPGALNLRQSRSMLELNTYGIRRMWGQLLRVLPGGTRLYPRLPDSLLIFAGLFVLRGAVEINSRQIGCAKFYVQFLEVTIFQFLPTL